MIPKKLVNFSQTLVNDGVEALNLPVGIVSHIYNGLYEIVAINSQISDFVSGAVFPLENTYCHAVYRTDKTIAITDINNVFGVQLHPLYISMPVEAYISAPIHYNGSVWGTINFTSSTIHPAFTPNDIHTVEAYAATLSKRLIEIDAISRAPWDV